MGSLLSPDTFYALVYCSVCLTSSAVTVYKSTSGSARNVSRLKVVSVMSIRSATESGKNRSIRRVAFSV
jgi:hypothetical protein